MSSTSAQESDMHSENIQGSDPDAQEEIKTDSEDSFRTDDSLVFAQMVPSSSVGCSQCTQPMSMGVGEGNIMERFTSLEQQFSYTQLQIAQLAEQIGSIAVPPVVQRRRRNRPGRRERQSRRSNVPEAQHQVLATVADDEEERSDCDAPQLALPREQTHTAAILDPIPSECEHDTNNESNLDVPTFEEDSALQEVSSGASTATHYTSNDNMGSIERLLRSDMDAAWRSTSALETSMSSSDFLDLLEDCLCTCFLLDDGVNNACSGCQSRTTIESLLACLHCPQVNGTNEAGVTCLHKAVSKGELELAEKILDHQDFNKANAKDANGETALHKAVSRADCTLVEKILDHPKFNNADAKDANCETALHKAACWGDSTLLWKILNHPKFSNVDATDADGETALHKVAWIGAEQIAKKILDHPNFTKANATTTRAGRTALHYAAITENAACVKTLLTHDKFILADHRDTTRAWNAAAYAEEALKNDPLSGLFGSQTVAMLRRYGPPTNHTNHMLW